MSTSSAIQSSRCTKTNKKLFEKAVCTHCCRHYLNLVTTTACKISIIQNTLDIIKEVIMLLVKVNSGKYNELSPFLF